MRCTDSHQRPTDLENDVITVTVVSATVVGPCLNENPQDHQFLREIPQKKSMGGNGDMFGKIANREMI
jgi:hypothetical protein